MIVAIGRIEDKNSLIGVRIYDTDKKSIKDIKIEDTDKIKIKNKSKIYRLGVVDNKTEDKPLILLGYKDRKALVIDINGRTKVLEDISKYETVDIKSNIEEYNAYISKLRLLGAEEVFNYEVKEDTDEVIITKYIPNNEKERIIEIPSFVTGIKKNIDGDNMCMFWGVNQSLKVIHRNNQIKGMDRLFNGFEGEKLDLSNFDTSKVTTMYCMFAGCRNLKELDLSNFDTSNVIDMSGMFNECNNLKELDLRNFNTSNVTDMFHMFCRCYQLKKLDLRNFDTSKVENMRFMFCKCGNLKSLDLSNFDTSKVTDMKCMFDDTSLTPENTGLKVKER